MHLCGWSKSMKWCILNVVGTSNTYKMDPLVKSNTRFNSTSGSIQIPAHNDEEKDNYSKIFGKNYPIGIFCLNKIFIYSFIWHLYFLSTMTSFRHFVIFCKCAKNTGKKRKIRIPWRVSSRLGLFLLKIYKIKNLDLVRYLLKNRN